VGCQFSIYPLRQDDIGSRSGQAIELCHRRGLLGAEGGPSKSTLLTRSEDESRALPGGFRAAQLQGCRRHDRPLAAGIATDELVAEAPGGGHGLKVPAPAGRVRSGDGQWLKQ